MTGGARLSVLFTGYAPVHFLCFQPLYERLQGREGVSVWLSGGLQIAAPDDHRLYDEHGLYDRLPVQAEQILPVPRMRDMDFDVLFAGNTKMIEPRSVGTRIQIFHGVSFRNKAVRARNLGCDAYFLVGPYMERRFLAAGLLAPDDPRVVRVGFMKTDALVNGTLDRAVTLERLGLDGSRPVLLYAPTGQKHNSLETIGPEAIGRLVASGRYDVVIKLHDHPKNPDRYSIERVRPLLGPHCRLAPDPDVIPLLHAADLLISDASSVTNEYTLLDRPIVFLDVPALLEHAERDTESQLDLETWGRRCGTVVHDPAGIESAVEQALSHPEAGGEVRRAMARDLFFHPGGATDVALAWLLAQRLASPAPPAAVAQ